MGVVVDSNNTDDNDNTVVVIRNSSGLNTVDVTDQGEIKISSFANVDFQDAVKVINTTQTLASVGGSNLSGRKSVVIFNKGGQTVYYGTTGVNDLSGIAIEKDELIELEVGDNIEIYIVTKTGNASVIIQEFA